MPVDIDEILMASAYYVCNSKVLLESVTQGLNLMCMVVAEVKVIVENGSLLLGVVQERPYLILENRIECKICSESHYVILLDERHFKVQTVVGIIFVETIVGIAIFIQKRQ